MRSALARQRTSTPGSVIHVLVLAPRRATTVGVDLASGAFVRLSHSDQPDSARPLRPHDVAACRVALVDELDLPREHPEAVVVASAPQRVGRMHSRQIDRYLRGLVQPRHLPVLGFCGPSTPFWTIDKDRPSVALVVPENEPAIAMRSNGVRCSFRWHGHTHDVPVDDPRVLRRLDWFPHNPVRGDALATVLGFRPARLLLTLSTPINGHCYKVVSSLLPR